jgi:hypothetical protein
VVPILRIVLPYEPLPYEPPGLSRRPARRA